MDLNLLIALDALLEENSVVGAAARLHLTPPAVSRTLARIRDVTKDDILVRAGRTMLPTPYALSIRHKVRLLVEQAESVLRPGRKLDLSVLDRIFTVRGHDVLLAALAPPLITCIAAQAPGVRVRFLGEAAGSDPQALRDDVDIELGAAPSPLPEIAHEVIGADRLVMACRQDHPLAIGDMSAAQLANESHIIVSRRGRLNDRIDDAFATLGLKRRVVASLPTCAAALEVIASNDLVTIVPNTLCAGLCKALGVTVRSIPLDLIETPVVLLWHNRFESDPAHAWIRACITKALNAALEAR